MRWLTVTAASVLLLGCQWLDVPGVSCTQIGCESQVVFELATLDLVPGRLYEVEACLDDRCGAATVELPQRGAVMEGGVLVSADEDIVALVLPEGDYSGTRAAWLEIRHGDGPPFVIEVEVELERTQPNGPNCPPVCWQAVVRA
jgi:hypothetical protein